MNKKLLGGMAIAAFFTLAAEIPPFYPAPQPEAPRNTAIAPAEISFSLSSGTKVEMKEYTKTRSLNGNWKFSGVERSAAPFADESKGFEAPPFDDSGWDSIAVPLNWYQKYKNVYDRKEPYNRGFYRHEFTVNGSDLANQRIVLHFKFIGYEATLWINGLKAGSHHGDFTPWTIDVTDFVKAGKNQFTMRVAQDFGTNYGDIAKAVRTYGSQWSASNFKGGIWGDAEIRFEPQVRVAKFFVTPQLDQNSVKLDLTLENRSGKTVDAALAFAVTDAMKKNPGRKLGESELKNQRLAPGTNRVSSVVKLDKPELWSPANPHLYYANAVVLEKGKAVSARAERFGYREMTVKNGKFHLNGERIYLFGENMPSVGFGGYGRSTAEESERLYKQLAGYKARGYNIIRNAHMPIMEEALDIADEIGILFYDEWSWSFTRSIDEEEFQRRNDKELLEWLERDCNHPSVVIWSCGNEVRHSHNPPVYRQLNRQVELMRQHDPQRRPAGSFSGSADFSSYGADPLTTDFLDLHSYLGNGNAPWTHWNNLADMVYRKLLQIYQRSDGKLDVPYIIWESVGFSWGGRLDPGFTPNDTAKYAAYVKKQTSWGQPEGVGYIGTLGLAAALDPARGLDQGKRIYGHRLLELQRQDLRFDGFAPWFHGYGLDAATIWNQVLLPGLRNYSHHQTPRSLFAGRSLETELFVVNSGSRLVDSAQFVVSFMTDKQRKIDGSVFELKELLPFTLYTEKTVIPVPAELRGNCQLRIELKENGKVVSQNFYNVFVAADAELDKPLPHTGTIALLDVGEAKDVETTARILNKFGLNFKVINANSVPESYRLAVIPAGIHNRKTLKMNREAIFEWMEKSGGTLLVLEQNSAADSLIGNTRLISGGQTMVDLVHPAHPVFNGLEPANFDTWENPDNFGHAVSVTISPFINNALAARGAMLGSRGVDNVIIEATLGKGRIFWTQLNAVSLADRDAVAATYLRNLFDYLLNRPMYDKVTELAQELRKTGFIDPAKLETVNLAPFANRSFSDEVDNDGKGGWTDQGQNDFRNMPLGKQSAGGVVFNIIDPAKNGGKSCLVLRGSERPAFPSEITGIPVNAKYTRLFFLHTAAWSEGDVGVYRIYYEDGTLTDYRIRHGINIGDWWNTTYLSDAAPGIMRSNPTKDQVGTYVAAWDNPHPEKTIKSFDFLAISSPLVKEINFNPSKTAIPVLVAVTGEKGNPDVVKADQRPGGGHDGKVEADKAVVAEVNTVLPDGSSGKAWRIDMKKPENGVPYVIARFNAANVDVRKYDTLSFFIKAEAPGLLDIRIPEADWKDYMSQTSVDISGAEWHKVRIDLKAAGRERFEGKKLRGEIFFFNSRAKNTGPIRFLISGIVLE